MLDDIDIHMDNTHGTPASQILANIPATDVRSPTSILLLPGVSSVSKVSSSQHHGQIFTHVMFGLATSLHWPPHFKTREALTKIPLTMCYRFSLCEEKSAPCCCALDPLTSWGPGTAIYPLMSLLTSPHEQWTHSNYSHPKNTRTPKQNLCLTLPSLYPLSLLPVPAHLPKVKFH